MNGKEMLNDLEFEQLIEKKDDRELLEFVARETYEHSKDMVSMSKDIAGNKKRSVATRFALLALILILVSLGIIDWTILRIF